MSSIMVTSEVAFFTTGAPPFGSGVFVIVLVAPFTSFHGFDMAFVHETVPFLSTLLGAQRTSFASVSRNGQRHIVRDFVSAPEKLHLFDLHLFKS